MARRVVLTRVARAVVDVRLAAVALEAGLAVAAENRASSIVNKEVFLWDVLHL